MQAICSSKTLYNALRTIHFGESEYVESVEFSKEGTQMKLKIGKTQNQEDNDRESSIAIQVIGESKNDWTVNGQSNRRWDHIRRTLSNVSEQPVVLDITEKKVRLSFDY